MGHAGQHKQFTIPTTSSSRLGTTAQKRGDGGKWHLKNFLKAFPLYINPGQKHSYKHLDHRTPISVMSKDNKTYILEKLGFISMNRLQFPHFSLQTEKILKFYAFKSSSFCFSFGTGRSLMTFLIKCGILRESQRKLEQHSHKNL